MTTTAVHKSIVRLCIALLLVACACIVNSVAIIVVAASR